MEMAKQTITEYKDKVRDNMAEITAIMKKAVAGDLLDGVKISQKDDEFTELRENLGSLLDELRHEKKTNGMDSSKRLSEITPVLQKVSLGDFTERLPIPEEGDEFTPLLIAINLMIDDFSGMVQSMKKKTDELEKRTEELKEIKENLELEVERRTERLEGQVEEIKEAEGKLKKSEEKFRTIVEQISKNVQIWETDNKGVYTYISPSSQWVFGFPLEKVVGKTPFDFMSLEEADRVGKEFRKIVKARKPFYNLENVVRYKDGTERTMLTSGVPIFNKDGKLCGYRGVEIDVSEREKVKQKLQSKIGELKKMNKLMVGRELKMVELKKEIEKLKKRQR